MPRYQRKTDRREIGVGCGVAYDIWKVYNNNGEFQYEEHHYYRWNGNRWVDTNHTHVKNALKAKGQEHKLYEL